MKAGISNIWLLGMIATFIFLFSCYVIISVNYTKSFKMKNEVLSIIERGKGITGTTYGSGYPSVEVDSKIYPGTKVRSGVPSFQTINFYLMGNSYTAKGVCPVDENPGCWYGVKSLEHHEVEKAVADTKYYYCFAKFRFTNSIDSGRYQRYYYLVRLFYKMELPVLDNWLAVRVDGRTAEIVDPQDTNVARCT